MSPFPFYEIKPEIRHRQEEQSSCGALCLYGLYRWESSELLICVLRFFFGLETGIDPDIFSRWGGWSCLLMWCLSGKMAASEILSLASTSWRLVPFIRTMPKDWPLRQFLLTLKVIERKKGAVTYLQRRRHHKLWSWLRVIILSVTRFAWNRNDSIEPITLKQPISLERFLPVWRPLIHCKIKDRMVSTIRFAEAQLRTSTQITYPAAGR